MNAAADPAAAGHLCGVITLWVGCCFVAFLLENALSFLKYLDLKPLKQANNIHMLRIDHDQKNYPCKKQLSPGSYLLRRGLWSQLRLWWVRKLGAESHPMMSFHRTGKNSLLETN